MPISSTTRKTSPFVGNGSLTSLPFAFKVFATSDVEVIRTNTSTGAKTTLVLSTDYTVSLNANQDTGPGGTVTLNSALATGYTAIVVSNIPQTQPTSLTNAGGFFPNVISAALDRAVAMVQQLQERLSRTPALPKNDTSSWPEIPVAVARANSVLGFDASGAPALIPKTDFVGPAGPTGATGAQGPQGVPGEGGVVSGDGLALAGGTMTGDITMKADADGGIIFARSSDDTVQGRIGRNNDAITLTGIGATIPLQLGANGTVKLSVLPNGAVRFEPLASAPSGPSAGQVYYDSTANALRFYDGSSWRSVSVGSGSSADGPLTMSAVSISNIDTDSATLSVLIGGEIPADSLMLIQWTTDIASGPWLGSDEPEPAVAGAFTWDASSLTPGTVYYARASVYSDPGGGLPTVIHAVTALATFTTSQETDSVPSYSRMVDEMDDPNDGRAMSWGSWANNPDNVATVGGPGGKPCPAVIVAGALGRGTTMDLTPFGGLDPVDSAFLDSDPWTIYTPWIVVIEQGDTSTGLVRQHTEDNCAIQFERHIFTAYRNSLSAYQTIRDRTDLQTWYTATEDWLLANGAVETRSPTSEEGAGIVVRWNRASGNAVHGSLVRGPIGFSTSEFENGIDLASIASDIRQIALACRIRIVPWNRSAPFNAANCKLLVHVGCDLRARDPHQTLPSGPGWPIPPNVLSRQRLLSASWDWYTACTLRDTIRSDRLDSSNAEWGFSKAQALSTPIPGWAA